MGQSRIVNNRHRTSHVILSLPNIASIQN